jgi:hypothetical protein
MNARAAKCRYTSYRPWLGIRQQVRLGFVGKLHLDTGKRLAAPQQPDPFSRILRILLVFCGVARYGFLNTFGGSRKAWQPHFRAENQHLTIVLLN